ncbi:MAG: MipA/OmpV family protein [Sphingopyxis sp.]|uniref:MipA/OmpV family protein n=1 Tax=Sphingopyxis sp. TaxID=1908224 RepID=UPI002ABC3DF3|nr:MipA/OmpV family protein [Sphingopyxis sp.]MDZ3830264.1 MipA/OmpV family protein [Sphingopyxis sp.]
MTARFIALPLFCAALIAPATPPAQAEEADETPAKRTRIFIGPQFFPEYPGAKDLGVGPFMDYSRSPVGTPFEFEAPDESIGLGLIGNDRFSIGPAANLVRKRRASDVGGQLPEVKRTIEVGAFAQAWITPAFRLRAEGRRGINGHDGWVGNISADYVARDGDDWLFSIGPRVTLADAKVQRAYFGVAPTDTAASGLASFRPNGGVQAVGVTAGFLRQLTPSLGIAAYARYDRLVGDAAKSPVTRAFGSRNQPSAGIALSYTFGGER